MSGYKKVSEKLARAIVPCYKAGMHPKDIAKQVGCAFTTVYAALHQENVDLQRRNYKRMDFGDISYTDIDPIWAAEFRGFFYGDGAALLSRQPIKDTNRAVYRPKLMISLRADNYSLLEDVQAHLGGSLDQVRGLTNSWGYQCNPTVRWYTCSYPNIFAILRDVLLPDARLPAKKRVQLEVLYEAVQARREMPHTLGAADLAILHKYYVRLKELKRYKSSCD